MLLCPLALFALRGLSSLNIWGVLAVMLGVVALVTWWIRRRKREFYAVGDAQTGAFLTVAAWPRARRPAVYLWHAPAAALALEVSPLAVPESASDVTPTALLSDYQRPKRATAAEAVKIGQLLLLDLIARGELIVRQRQTFSALGPAEFSAWATIYELVRPVNPTGASLSELDERLLRPFALLPAETPLSAEALIGGLYERNVYHPAAYLAELAGRPLKPYSAAALQLMRSTLNQRLAAVTAQNPQLIAAWDAEIGRAIASHEDRGGGG